MNGMSRRAVDAALDGVAYDPTVKRHDGGAAMFGHNFAGFAASHVTPGMVARGRAELKRYAAPLAQIEQRFGVREPNITTWRRAVAGDLTSAFNFKSPNDALVPLPDTDGLAPKDYDKHPDVHPTPPTTQVMPKQERGVARARALPYELHVKGHADAGAGDLAGVSLVSR